MFILFFTIFTFIFTVFENFFIWIAVLILLFLWIIIFNKYSLKKSLTKIWFLFFAFVLTFLAVGRKQYDYFLGIPPSYFQNNSWNLISNQKPNPQLLFYMWTGQVVDTNSQGKYIFQDGQWREYFLITKKKYQIGDQIFLDGYIQPWRVEINLIYKLKDQINQSKKFFNDISLSWLIHYEFDYSTRLMMKDYYWTIHEQNSIKIQNIDNWTIWNFRKNLQSKIVQSYGENRVSWLILWMLIWDRSQIPKQDYQWFIDSWLVHLIAVSWWNIIMIVAFLWLILFFLPFYVRNFVIICIVIFYALICGLDSSVFRATIMWGLWLIVLFRWKEINIRRSMSIAFVTMLLINPYFLVYDVWFLLSFGAIIWILYLNNWKLKIDLSSNEGNWKIKDNNSMNKISKFKQIIEKFKKTKIWSKFFDFIASYIKPTIWATIGIFPLIIFFMWKINLVSLLGNVLVLPIVPFVMIYGFVSIRVYQFFHWERILWIEKLLVNYIYRVSEIIWQKWIYLMVEWDWIKYLILIFAIIIFVVYKVWKVDGKKKI